VIITIGGLITNKLDRLLYYIELGEKEMPKEPMKMTVEEIKDAMINPEIIKHLHGLKVSNQWGTIDGRQLLIDVYRLCQKYEELQSENSNDLNEKE
jgi:hypothetical protein